MKNQTSSAFVVINRWTSKIVAEASHYQEAAKVADVYNEAWKQQFVGPPQSDHPVTIHPLPDRAGKRNSIPRHN